MKNEFTLSNVVSGLFGIAVFAVGVLNVVLVHPVPGIAYLLLSFIYFPPANALLWRRLSFPVSLTVKVALGIVIFMFTLGVSDLGDMID